MTRQNVELSIALSDNERTRPLTEGRTKTEGIDLIPTVIHPSEMFWRQLRFAEFDVSEMSLSSLLIAYANGDTSWVALPVFTTRKFFHTWAIVRDEAGIRRPEDLRGKKVGVPEYQQTAAIWSRGILRHEFGVLPEEITWFMERAPDKSHGAATRFSPPQGVTINRIPEDADIGTMLLDGGLDAALLHISSGNLVDRSRTDLSTAARIRPLFADPAAEGRRYFNKTGLYPINHTVVVRRSLLDRHPWLALNLYSAFAAAKDQAAKVSGDVLQGYFDTGVLNTSMQDLRKKDPLPYGMKANRRVLETISQYVHEQGLTRERVAVESIFARSTLDL